MGTEIKQKTVDVAFEEGPDGKLSGNVVPETDRHAPSDKVLRLHFSLMGETSPAACPLSSGYGSDEVTKVHRYDWVVGATPVEPCYDWNWFDQIAQERAVIIQLLIDPQQSGCGYTELNAFLLALQPSKDTTSWAERNAEKLGEGLGKLSNMAEPFSKLASNILKTSAVMSNFVTSNDNGGKNWFIYRFLDEKRKCVAVEWNVSRNVLRQYGSVLRGSLLMAFHGDPKPLSPLSLLLRPRVHFENNGMDYTPPVEHLEETDPVALSINPIRA